MSSIKTPSEILEIAKYCQPLAANDISNNIFLKGGSLDQSLAMKIYMERKGLQWIYDKDPNNSSLRNGTNYLYRLLGKYVAQANVIIGDQAQGPPVVTGPDDDTVNEGGTASFSINITSALPYTTAWYKNGVIIPGETGSTYSFTAALADDGNTYNAIVTNAAGSAISDVATLTVNTALIGYQYYGDVDYFNELNSGIDNITYNFTFPITNLAPLSVPLPSGATPNKWLVTKYPDSQGVKTSWYNDQFNSGTLFNDFNYRNPISFGGFVYLISRQDLSLNVSMPLIFS